MRLLGRVFLCIMLMISSLTFFACKMPELPALSCTGIVTFSESALVGVAIKTNVKEYAKTDSFGRFSFETKSKGIVIFAQKEGYIFEPKSIELVPGENTANFTAKKIEMLSGELRLKEVIITPTSIVQSSDNYLYNNNGWECLKASDITLTSIEKSLVLNESPIYLNKAQKNVITVGEDFIFSCGEQFSLGIAVNTYFKNNNHEGKTSNAEEAMLYVKNKQTNADLVNNEIIYNLYGINNKTKNFTIDISFVFEFIEEI